MNKELAAKNTALIQWTPDQIATIKNTVAKDATDDELKMFLHLSQTYGLDPFAKEIWFIKMDRTPTIMTSRDGYLKIANNHPEFKGVVSDVVYEGDSFRKTPDGVDHQYAATKRGNIVGSYALVYREGIRFPVYVFAPFKDYNNGRGIWSRFPHAMILKVAESMALKRAFSLSGLVSREELGELDVEQAAQKTRAAQQKPETPKTFNNNNNHNVSPKIEAEQRKKRIYDGYLRICGNSEHAKNAIFGVTERRGSREWTEMDMANLELDLKRRQKASQREIPWAYEEPEREPDGEPDSVWDTGAAEMGIGPDSEESEIKKLRIAIASSFGNEGLGCSIAKREEWIKENFKVEGLMALNKEGLKKVLNRVHKMIRERTIMN